MLTHLAYEFDSAQNTPKYKKKDFGALFINSSKYTDDSLLSVSICDALLKLKGKNKSDKEIKKEFEKNILAWANNPLYKHIAREYGGNFGRWVRGDIRGPYNSFGNGSALRVGAVGWLFDSLEETRKYARLSAEITHNHPEGMICSFLQKRT